MPQTLHCVILYSENFHHVDQKAAKNMHKKAGIESLVIANFHYTDKIKAIDIQYKAADNDKGLQILTFNWKRPKDMAHANVPGGPKQVAKGYKAALKKMKPSVRRASFSGVPVVAGGLRHVLRHARLLLVAPCLWLNTRVTRRPVG